MYLGCDATLTVFVKELKCLWSPGMLVDDIYYRVALVSGIWDGRGFEKVTLTQGGGSLAGCNDCNFPGFTFANTVTYPFASMYAPIGDSRRLEELDNSVPNHHIKYNLLDETRLPPVNRTYDDYIRNGHAFINRPDKKKINQRS